MRRLTRRKILGFHLGTIFSHAPSAAASYNDALLRRGNSSLATKSEIQSVSRAANKYHSRKK